MVTKTEIKTATIEELNAELAAGGMPSGETDISEARKAVRAMIAEFDRDARQVPSHLVIGPAKERRNHR